jgi:hypothetical protein
MSSPKRSKPNNEITPVRRGGLAGDMRAVTGTSRRVGPGLVSAASGVRGTKVVGSQSVLFREPDLRSAGYARSLHHFSEP